MIDQIKDVKGITFIGILPIAWVNLKKKEAKEKGYKWSAYARYKLYEALQHQVQTYKKSKKSK